MKQSRISEIDELIKAEIQKGCKACNDNGAYHCAYPDECGNWDKVHKLEAEKQLLTNPSSEDKKEER